MNYELNQSLVSDWAAMLDDGKAPGRRLGSGGFADVYEVVDPDGVTYALKHFRDPSSERESVGWENFVNSCIENVRRNATLFSKNPFAQVRFVPNETRRFYVMDYVDGESVEERLEQGEDLKDPEKARKVLLTYARMLEDIHSQDRVFVDNNWGAVVVNDNYTNARVCDYDLISQASEINKPGHFARGVKRWRYAPRAQLANTEFDQDSDLEAFSLMIDHLYNRGPWIQVETLSGGFSIGGPKAAIHKHRNAAKYNRRRYKANRREKLPEALGDLVDRSLTYPQTRMPSASDFVRALEGDLSIN